MTTDDTRALKEELDAALDPIIDAAGRIVEIARTIHPNIKDAQGDDELAASVEDTIATRTIASLMCEAGINYLAVRALVLDDRDSDHPMWTEEKRQALREICEQADRVARAEWPAECFSEHGDDPLAMWTWDNMDSFGIGLPTRAAWYEYWESEHRKWEELAASGI